MEGGLHSLVAVQPGEARMHRTKLVPDSAVEYSSSREFDKTRSDCDVYIPDCHRSARLLRALRDLDESLSELEELPEAELSDLVCSVLRECGFVDPIEAWYAIADVLEVIDAPAPVMDS